MTESGNKEIKDMELGNSNENLEKFDKCTLPEGQCGFRTKDGFCLWKDRCAFSLSEKYLNTEDINDKPTVEAILEVLKKAEKGIAKADLLAMIPKDEMQTYSFLDDKKQERTSAFVIDRRGNILNLRNLNVIKRNLKK